MHSDESNPYIETLEGFEAEIKKFKPAALVVGGLQMLDNFPFEEGNNNYLSTIYIYSQEWCHHCDLLHMTRYCTFTDFIKKWFKNIFAFFSMMLNVWKLFSISVNSPFNMDNFSHIFWRKCTLSYLVLFKYCLSYFRRKNAKAVKTQEPTCINTKENKYSFWDGIIHRWRIT